MATQKQIIYWIIIIAGIALFLFGMMWIALADATAPVTHTPVKCYDRFQNEIQGLNCLQDGKDYLPVLFPFPLPLALIGFLIIILGCRGLMSEMERLSSKKRGF